MAELELRPGEKRVILYGGPHDGAILRLKERDVEFTKVGPRRTWTYVLTTRETIYADQVFDLVDHRVNGGSR
jgi:hypothetical protein